MIKGHLLFYMSADMCLEAIQLAVTLIAISKSTLVWSIHQVYIRVTA